MTNTIQTQVPDNADAMADEGDEYSGYVSEEEARKIFDESAHYYLGISGEEFLRRWDAGEWQTTAERESIMSMLMILPLVR